MPSWYVPAKGAELGTGAGEYSHGAIERAASHDYFAGRPEWAGNDVLHRLRNRRNGANPG